MQEQQLVARQKNVFSVTLRSARAHTTYVPASLITLFLLFGIGCSTITPPIELSEPEKIQRDISLGRVLHEKFVTEILLKKDQTIESFVKNIAVRLVDDSSRLKGSVIEIHLINQLQSKAQEKQKFRFTSQNTAFGLPGIRLYLSQKILKLTKYENEIAALLAIEVAHVELRHIVKKVEDNISRKFRAMEQSQFASDLYSSSIDFFGPNGIFSYTEEENIEAIERAVELIYNIGYDPRGVISVISFPDIYNSEFRKRVEVYVAKARLKIATKAPIRNPITRSSTFLNIQQRIEAL